MAEIKNKSEEELVLYHSARIMETIAKYIHDRPELHRYGITAVGYAVEMLLSLPHEGDEEGFDDESREFRKFLGIIHGDVRSLMRTATSSKDLLN